MDNTLFTSYKIEDRSYVSFIKREIHNALSEAGFSSSRIGEIDIIVAELTSNLIKHADKGEMIYLLSEAKNNKAFEIFCIDNGPGVDNIVRLMKDGTSTTNTLGTGLGAMQRLSDFFEIYSMNKWGTVAYSKSLMNPVAKKTDEIHNQLHIKTMKLSYPGEKVCGDGFYIKRTKDETHIFLGDGLGHGQKAHEAVQLAIGFFKECSESLPSEILKYIHPRVKRSRGLVASIAVYNHRTNQWKIAGVGNISTTLYQGARVKNYTSHNGTLGLNIPNSISNHEIEATQNQCIIMFSDGIRSSWNLSAHPTIFKYDPAIIASAIYKDFARGNDDMTVLVGKLTL